MAESTPTDGHDVYAYGVVACSTLHLLRHDFPPREGYGEIVDSFVMTGGEALNSSIVMSRLGLRVKLDGNWIGDTAEGRALVETITAFGIDASRLAFTEGPGAREIVFSDNGSRTIFGNYIQLLTSGRQWNVPRETDIAEARIVTFDPPFADESRMVARVASDLGKPFVSIDCDYDSMLATEAAAVIISGEFRRREYPDFTPEALCAEYQSRSRGLVVMTRGERAMLFGRKGEAFHTLEAFPVDAIDTAGGGDAFRAGIVYGLLQPWTDRQVVRFAAAVAAQVCASFPGVLESPSVAETTAFIAGHEKPKQ